MTTRASTAIVLFILAQGLGTAGCGDEGFVAPPTAPNPSPNTPPAPNFISGTVVDTVSRPLGGARVEVVDGPQAGAAATVSAIGNFSLSGTFDDTTRFRATKDGYAPAIGTLLPFCAACNPNRWIHFTLEPTTPSLNLAGRYTLAFTADGACDGLPDELRTRTYAATITPSPVRPNTAFNVTLDDHPFLQHFKTFPMGVAGDYVVMWLGDFHGQPGLVERVAPNTYLALEGAAAATVPSDTSTMSFPLDGAVEYCAQPAEMGAYYECTPGQAGARARCASRSHRLVLTRR